MKDDFPAKSGNTRLKTGYSTRRLHPLSSINPRRLIANGNGPRARRVVSSSGGFSPDPPCSQEQDVQLADHDFVDPPIAPARHQGRCPLRHASRGTPPVHNKNKGIPFSYRETSTPSRCPFQTSKTRPQDLLPGAASVFLRYKPPKKPCAQS